MGWLVTRQGETYIFQYGNTPRSVTFKSLAISLVEGKIKLEEFGKYVMTITFSQFDTIGGIAPTDISNAYDLIIGLGQPPYPVFNFDIGLFGTAMFDNYGIDDEASFITYLEAQGATNVVVTDFTLTSNRLRCGLTFDDGTTLFLEEFGINKLYDLSSLIGVTIVSLGSNQISKIEGLSSSVNLLELYLQNNQITTIENLDSLINLSVLSLGQNQITKIENLDSLINLSVLSLGQNQISKIEGLSTLVNLNYLYLNENQISKIENLDSLINLTTLDIAINQITKIEGLSTLVNLNYLYLNENQITKIEGIETLTSLLELYLDTNQISILENLNTLVNLEQLNLRNNLISVINPIDELVSLTYLGIDNNQITTAQFDNLSGWATDVISEEVSSQIHVDGNVDEFNTSTTYPIILAKNWTIH